MNRSISIAGGGLAGLSLAAGLRMRDVPVCVHEAGTYPRHRVCGEFLSGLKPQTLQALGIEGALSDAAQHRKVLWFRKGAAIREQSLPEPAMALSRYALDQRLCNHVRDLGGEVLERSRLRKATDPGNVWAAGRIPQRGEWIGLKCHCTSGLQLASDLEMHLGNHGYVGLAGVEDNRVNVCGLFRLNKPLRAEGSNLLLAYLRAEGLEVLADRIASSRRDEASFCAVAGFALGWQGVAPGVCAIGDAGAMIAPFTGNGMSMAIQSAEIAVEPLSEWSKGKLAWKTCQSRICDQSRRLFQTRMAASKIINAFFVRPLGQKLVTSLLRHRLIPMNPLLSLIR